MNRAAGTPVRVSFAVAYRPARRVTRPRPAAPVEVTRVDPAVMRAALALAGGDPARLLVQRDGSSVLVLNHPRRGQS